MGINRGYSANHRFYDNSVNTIKNKLYGVLFNQCSTCEYFVEGQDNYNICLLQDMEILKLAVDSKKLKDCFYLEELTK